MALCQLQRIQSNCSEIQSITFTPSPAQTPGLYNSSRNKPPGHPE
jgi:hypothetical protein